MNPKILLRTASVIMLLHVIGHTIGHSGWKKAPDPEKQEVITHMTGKSFAFMGAERSMGDYYDGYGYASTLAMLLVIALLWVLSGETSPLAQKGVLLVTIFLFGWGVDELIYFFPMAAGFSLVSGLFALISFFQLRKSNTPGP